MIKQENGKTRYFDRNGTEITEGSRVRYASGRVLEIYLTTEGTLGTDATNPDWIASGRAAPCEYGIYPLTADETNEVEVITE